MNQEEICGEEFSIAIYCSAALNDEFVEYIKNIYNGKNDELCDIYEDDEVDKKKIDDIIQKVKEKKQQVKSQDNDREY